MVNKISFKTHPLVLLSLLAWACGCARLGNGRPVPRPDPIRISDPPPAAALPSTPAESLLTTSQLSCDRSGNCPTGIAMVVSALDSKNIRACTGFSVGPDQIVTSADCLPGALAQPGAACEGRIRIFFGPAAEAPMAGLACTRVVALSGSGDAAIAYLRLEKPVDGLAFEIAPAEGGPSESDRTLPVTMAKVDTLAELPNHGIIRAAQCSLLMRPNGLLPEASPESPILPVSGCGTVPSNAGAPLLDEQGRVRGVFLSRVSEGLLDELRERFRIDLPQDVGWVENLSCLSESGCGGSRVASMDENAIGRARDARIKELRDLATDQSRKWSGNTREHAEVFRWAVRDLPSSDGTSNWAVAPECFRPPSQWLGSYRYLLTRAVSADSSMEFKVPAWRASVNLDDSLRIVGVLDPQDDLWLRIRFNPGNLDQSGESGVQVEFYGKSDGKWESWFSVEMPVCAPSSLDRAQLTPDGR